MEVFHRGDESLWEKGKGGSGSLLQIAEGGGLAVYTRRSQRKGAAKLAVQTASKKSHDWGGGGGLFFFLRYLHREGKRESVIEEFRVDLTKRRKGGGGWVTRETSLVFGIGGPTACKRREVPITETRQKKKEGDRLYLETRETL